MDRNDCCVLIPSLSPDQRLEKYADQLLEAGFGGLLVVDDGSAAEYQPIFERLAKKERCTVLHHEVNYGKGRALKTGFSYIRDHTPFRGVVTADSDGQHTVEDALNLCSLLREDEEALLLGSRDFSKGSVQVPPKSRAGNRITSAVFRVLYGPKLPDTQTGLRAFPAVMIPMMLGVKGDRFEYEMNQLIQCALTRIPMKVIPIKTIYLDENKGTHFHPIRDSWRIYKLIFAGFFKFISASVISFCVDYLLFFLLSTYVVPAIWSAPVILFDGTALRSDLRQLVATYGARIVSSIVNYRLNRKFVFTLKSSPGAAGRYVILCVAVATVSGLTVGALHLLFPTVSTTLLKIPVDIVLFIANYFIQKNWVFRPVREKAAG